MNWNLRSVATAAVLFLAAASTALAADPIRVGEVNPYSGSLAVYGLEVTRGHEIAVDEANAAGGVLGRKIELIRGDATNPQQAIAVVEQLATRDKVDLFAGTYVSAVSNAASDAALRYNKLYWETNGTAQDLTDRGLPNFVRTGPNATSFAVRSVEALKELVAPELHKSSKDVRIWIEHEDFSFGTSIAQTLRKLLEADGIKPVGVGSHSFKAIDMNDVVLRARQAKPDVFVMIGFVPDGNLLLKNMRDQGYKVPIMFVGMGDTKETLEPNGVAGVERILSVSYPRPDLPEAYSPSGKKYVEEYKAKYHQEPVASLGMTAYVGFKMLIEAIQAAGSTDVEKVRAAAAKMDKPFGSYAGGYGVKFDDKFQNTRALPVVIQWQSGQVVTVYPKEARAPGAAVKPLLAQP
jgi:branched-chain amino acid transport system substrate-binding protein